MKNLTQDIVKSLLDYNPKTGILTWKKRDASYFSSMRHCLTWNTKNAGKRAGSINKNPKTGYKNRQITILGDRHYEHKVIWLYMTGEKSAGEIDHKNQDATDNRWSNIRMSSYPENNRNVSMRRNNTSGKTGVYWHKRAKKWVANCWFDGDYYYLGLHADIESAGAAVAHFRKLKGFSPGHGITPSGERFE